MDSGLSHHINGNGSDGDPAIQVNPDYVDLGTLGPNESNAKPFTIKSVGSNNSILRVSGIDIEEEFRFDEAGKEHNASGTFTLTATDGDFSFLLPKGKEREIVATCTPEHPGEYETLLTVRSDDDGSPATPVILVCKNVAPELEITPDPLDMGTINVGCERDNWVTMCNVGNADLRVDDIRQLNDIFSIDPPRLPFTLEPGECEEMNITFTPEAQDDYVGIIEVDSNEAVGTRQAVQWGSGLVPQSFHQELVLEANPMTDIVFYVDQSVSMENDQEELAENFWSFIEWLSPYTPDWQIAVVTNDDGCTETGPMTPATANYMSKFGEAAMNGAFGSNTERGLEIVYNTAKKSFNGECGGDVGLFREGSLAHIVMVSDEPDQSPRGWEFTYDEIVRMKGGDPDLVKFSAVIGPVPGGCTEESDDGIIHEAGPGTGYKEAVLASGGVESSICSDWAQNVAILASTFKAPKGIELENDPDPFTIQVDLNGTPFTAWTYDGDSNSIVFNAGVSDTLQDGDRFDVYYSQPTGCD